MNPIIKYTSRTYQEILNDINSIPELADKPKWFKDLIAGVGDVLDVYINAQANQTNPYTAFTRKKVSSLLRLIDYYLSAYSTSSGQLLFDIKDDAVFPVIVDKADLVAFTSGTLATSSKRFEARETVVFPETVEGFTTAFTTNSQLTVSRSYITGEKVRVFTDGTIPAPLSIDTDYYAIYISATKILLATTREKAYAGEYITLTSNGTGNHQIQLFSLNVTGYQQKSNDDYKVIGASDGVTEWQVFDLPDDYVLSDELIVRINGDTFTMVDSWIDSTSTDKHFKVLYLEDNKSQIEFGNGVYGAIPDSFDIEVFYAVGGGSTSNVSFVNRIKTYGGSNSNITGVSNSTIFTGGGDEENITSAKLNAPVLLKARDRFVTAGDGEAIAGNYSGVSIAKVNRNVYGKLSAQVLIVPDGGGLPSTSLKNNLRQLLIDKSILEEIDVRVDDQTYIQTSITSAIKTKTGFLFSDIKNYCVLAFRLALSERGKEFQNEYLQNGITSVISMINDHWLTSFTSADASQITKLISNLEYVEFGKDIQSANLISYVDTFVDGVDYLTISSPAFPVVIGNNEISQDNINPANITELV